MGEFNQVLWTLDREIAPQDFERLCVDLLCRDGYWKIVPVGGTKDRGRDAEASYWRGRSGGSAVVAFQFSLQGKWEKKLRSDAAKIAAHCPEASALVFITSQSVTGEKRDKLATEFKAKLGWMLAIYDREWLRLRLEEMHPDLAKKYLGLDLPPTASSVAGKIDTSALDGPSARELFRDQSPERVRAAIIESTRKEPGVAAHWKRLAKIEDYLENFRAALVAVNRGLELDPTDPNLELLKGAIIAELGIETQSRPLLVQAKEIFSRAAAKLNRAVDHYNLANVLSPLGEPEAAEESYLRSLALRPNYAPCWKNLGTLLTQQGRHEEGMECFDKALALEPALIEAHLSKANTWLLFRADALKAVACFEQAYILDPGLDQRWHHARYWFSRALAMAGRLEEALAQVEAGLAGHPDDMGLLNQKAGVLRLLWPANAAYVDTAFAFFSFRAESIRNDYAGLAELLKLSARKGVDAWPFLERNLEHGSYSLRGLAEAAGVTLASIEKGLEVASIYRRFRARHGTDDHIVTLRGQGLMPRPGIEAALDHMLLPIFGEVAERYQAATERNEIDVPALLATLPIRVSRIFTGFGADWLCSGKPETREEQIRLLSIGMVCVTDAVVAESARIVGFLAGHFGFPLVEWQEGRTDWSELYAETGVSLMERVVSGWGLISTA